MIYIKRIPHSVDIYNICATEQEGLLTLISLSQPLSVVQYQSLLMARFKVIGMNWGLLFASLATRATIWFQQALHSGLALQMAKEEENGQRQILSANVRAL